MCVTQLARYATKLRYTNETGSANAKVNKGSKSMSPDAAGLESLT